MSFPFLQPYAGLSNSLQTAQAAGGPGGAVGGWVELARTTLGSSGSSIDVTSLPDKRYYMVLTDVQSSGITNIRMRNNGDSGNNYASRWCDNGGTDSTIGSFNNMVCHNQNVTVPQFMVSYGSNRSSSEKLWIHKIGIQNTAGAGNAPLRGESVSKHAQTTNPIDQITIFEGESGSFDTNSECVVLAYDPDDNHTSNFWEELASVTASGSSSNMEASITSKKYIWVQAYMSNSALSKTQMVVGNGTVDTSANYASRYSNNGGSDSTQTNLGTMKLNGNQNQAANVGRFVNVFIINNSSNEKLAISNYVFQNTAGAGNAPSRVEGVHKWANTSNQIDKIQITTPDGNINSDGIMKVWGAD